ncbi:hypothetical protein CRUP_003854 [Coryphaenoides rupestris]|nr:hypothetical protein CRUP_003854 [Coryphaenoides rupestris]
MSKRAKHASCSVVGCTEPRASLHRTPAAEDVSAKWIDFIYHGNVPATVGKGHLYVCGNHFLPDCFANLGPYKAGLADKLFLKEEEEEEEDDDEADSVNALSFNHKTGPKDARYEELVGRHNNALV